MRAYDLPSALRTPAAVTELYLSQAGLEVLPSALWSLTNLKVLDLSHNRLRQLPDRFGELAGLKKLVLSDNQLQELPAGLAHLSNLEELRLDGNALVVFPAALAVMAGLRHLDLAQNRIGSLPETAGAWPALRRLNLAGNHLRRLPDLSLAAPRLEVLDLSENRLERLPDWIGGSTGLRILRLGGNRLETLPATLSACSRIAELNLQRNRIAGWPEVLFRLPALRRLDLSRNRMRQAPSFPAGLLLEQLDLSRNRLEAIGSLETLPHLRKFDASRNRLTALGVLPPALRELRLSHNELPHLNLPASGSRLQCLLIDHNPLRQLPQHLAQCRELQQLKMQKTGISGAPEALFRMEALQTLKGDWPYLLSRKILHLHRSAPAFTPAEKQAAYTLWVAPATASHLPIELLLRLSRLPLRELSKRAGLELINRLAERELPHWEPGLAVFLAGRFAGGKKRLETTMARAGIRLASAPEEAALLVLGEPPYPLTTIPAETPVCTFAQWSKALAGRQDRHQQMAPTSDIPDRIRRMLFHPNPVQVRLGIQLMKGMGVPDRLHPLVLAAWMGRKEHDGGRQALRVMLQQILAPPDQFLLARAWKPAWLKASDQEHRLADFLEGSRFEPSEIRCWLTD